MTNYKLIKWLLPILILVGLVFGASYLFSKTNQIFSGDLNPLSRFGKLIVGSDKALIGEEAGQVNVLLLGIGGVGHEGPLLTDTMIVASIYPESNEVILISIPRDFMVQLNGRGFGKINASYAYAEESSQGSGGIAATTTAEKVTGLTIPYYAVVDFKGFVLAVNHIGGLDIMVERTFTDASYPDYKGGYLRPVTFQAGLEHMNGERALMFARSRQGNNNEGSDFARSVRQKKILIAFKEKILKLNLTDLRTINNLLSDFTANFRTNLEPHEIKRLVNLSKNIPAEKIYPLSLEPQGNLICDGLLDDYTNHAYVIAPCEGKTLNDVHEFVAQSLLISKLKQENASVEVQNSTPRPSVIQNFQAEVLASLNIKVVPYRSKVPYDRTILYDNSSGRKVKTLDYLKNNFNFTLADVPYPTSSADFVIIFGKDSL